MQNIFVKLLLNGVAWLKIIMQYLFVKMVSLLYSRVLSGYRYWAGKYRSEGKQSCITRALISVNIDVDSDYQIIQKNDSKYIEPPLSPLHRELVLLQAKMHFVKITRSLKEKNISFKSGDKQVKRSEVNWKDIVKSLQDEYDRLLNREKPSSNSKFEIITTPNIKPLIYRRGKNLE